MVSIERNPTRAVQVGSITVGANDRCMSTGPVEVTGSAVVTVASGGVWVVL